MLLGPPAFPRFPGVPRRGADLEDIRKYLENLDEAVQRFFSSIVINSVAVVGLRGLSGSGVGARNFVQSLNIGNATLVEWKFSTPEPDPSYLIFHSYTTTGAIMVRQVRSVSSVLFEFRPATPSGLVMDCFLARM